jgi:hypothetical protein
MKIAELDLDNIFQDCFTTSAGPVVECNCGREHVCITSDYFENDDKEMIANYYERAKTDKNLILNMEYDTIAQVEVGGKQFVEDCECEGWKPFMQFIISERKNIKNFLIRLSQKAQQALEHEKVFNVLKDKEHEVLDDWRF